MNFTKLNYQTENRIAFVTMNAPKNMNAMDETMIEELVAAFRLADEDAGVKVIVLRSACRIFSAGGDIAMMYQGLQTGELDFAAAVQKFADVSLCIKKLRKPVICAVNGAAAGAGFNVALACDYIIADSKASFIQAFVNIGLVPDAGGFYLLTRSLGVNKATEIAMTGRPVSADEAQSLGFVAQIVAPEELEAATLAAAKRFSFGPSLPYAEMKRLLWESEYKDFESFVKEEVKSQTLCTETEDFREGITAFIEKRRPSFQ